MSGRSDENKLSFTFLHRKEWADQFAVQPIQ